MKSKTLIFILMFVMSVLSCNSVRKIQRIRNGEIEVSMSLPDDSVEEGEENA